MSLNDGNIRLNRELTHSELSKIIQRLSYSIAMQYMWYLNDDYQGKNEWDYTIIAKNDNYTLKIKINEWDLDKEVKKWLKKD